MRSSSKDGGESCYDRPYTNTAALTDGEGRRLCVCVRPSRKGRDGDVIAGVEAHTHRTMKNISHGLGLAGCKLEEVVKTKVWLDDARDLDEFNRVYSEFFLGNKPARSAIKVKNMVDTEIEIDVIAYKP